MKVVHEQMDGYFSGPFETDDWFSYFEPRPKEIELEYPVEELDLIYEQDADDDWADQFDQPPEYNWEEEETKP